MIPDQPAISRPKDSLIAWVFFGLCLAYHLWGTSVGWKSQQMPGNEFRQTQTAITAFYVQKDNDFSLAYPTPVLGKPWSMPFEFPLYQWAVVVVSNTTGLPLVQAGRAVSWACLYLALPAIWLLFGRLGVGRPGRWVALGVVLTCPLLVFYARAFLIETMALMFSLWFVWSFVMAVERRSFGWLAMANVTGVLAGLVKVTTFIVYLAPAGICSLVWLWQAFPRAARPGNSWPQFARLAGWAAATAAIPLAATWAWERFTDQVRGQNPSGFQFRSSTLHEYAFGTWQMRIDPETWAHHWRIQVTNLAPGYVLAIFAVLALLVARRWWGWIAGCLFAYCLVQAVFPYLYTWHEYYYVAIAPFLITAMGLVGSGLLESKWPRVAVWAILAGLMAAQVVCYHQHLYPHQKMVTSGSDGISDLVREVTDPDDVMIVVGEDWSSIRPYYAQRRALMVRRYLEIDTGYLQRAFSALKGEKVRVLLLRLEYRESREFRDMVRACFGIETEPVAGGNDTLIYVHPDLRPRFEKRLGIFPHRGVVLAQPPVPPSGANGRPAVALASLTPTQQEVFDMMSPKPVRFFSSFGLDAGAFPDGRRLLNAHPDFRLWFAPAPGRRVITAEYGILPGAYENMTPGGGTDGVEFSIERVRADGSKETLYRRLLKPAEIAADRGTQKAELPVQLAAGEELLFAVGPGPANYANYDWAYWGGIRIE